MSRNFNAIATALKQNDFNYLSQLDTFGLALVPDLITTAGFVKYATPETFHKVVGATHLYPDFRNTPRTESIRLFKMLLADTRADLMDAFIDHGGANSVTAKDIHDLKRHDSLACLPSSWDQFSYAHDLARKTPDIVATRRAMMGKWVQALMTRPDSQIEEQASAPLLALAFWSCDADITIRAIKGRSVPAHDLNFGDCASEVTIAFNAIPKTKDKIRILSALVDAGMLEDTASNRNMLYFADRPPGVDRIIYRDPVPACGGYE